VQQDIYRPRLVHIFETGQQVRVLLRSSPKSPAFAARRSVEWQLSSLTMSGLSAPHCAAWIRFITCPVRVRRTRATCSRQTSKAHALGQVAAEADIERLIFIITLVRPRLRFPVNKAKMPKRYRKSGVPYTIIRHPLFSAPKITYEESSQLLRIAPVLPHSSEADLAATTLGGGPGYLPDLSCRIRKWSIKLMRSAAGIFHTATGARILMNVTTDAGCWFPSLTVHARSAVCWMPSFATSAFRPTGSTMSRSTELPVDNMPRIFGFDAGALWLSSGLPGA